MEHRSVCSDSVSGSGYSEWQTDRSYSMIGRISRRCGTSVEIRRAYMYDNLSVTGSLLIL